MATTQHQEERFALATHFYVRLKRHLNRVVDAVWMSTNDEYAREIVRLARSHGDPELEILADRFEALMKGGKARGIPASGPITAAPGVDRSVAQHYTGALR